VSPLAAGTLWGRWKRWARRLKTQLYALYLAYRDPRVPWYAKIFAGLVLAYALSPLDLIPDFIPILGYLDDVVLLPLGIALAVRMVPKQVLEECRQRARQRLCRGALRTWPVTLLIALLWAALLGLAAWRVARRIAAR
jgi:uncharacterized membrane protein YkvA (DUF1232 family)